jgi:hypothetical protein
MKDEGLVQFRAVFLTRGFIWDLEIALSGVAAKIQPNGLYFFSPSEGPLKRRVT